MGDMWIRKKVEGRIQKIEGRRQRTENLKTKSLKYNQKN
jgi:hypothetical protein